jgi:hypothetical protein
VGLLVQRFKRPPPHMTRACRARQCAMRHEGCGSRVIKHTTTRARAALPHRRQSFWQRDAAPSPETRHSAGLRRGCRLLARESTLQIQSPTLCRTGGSSAARETDGCNMVSNRGAEDEREAVGGRGPGTHRWNVGDPAVAWPRAVRAAPCVPEACPHGSCKGVSHSAGLSRGHACEGLLGVRSVVSATC